MAEKKKQLEIKDNKSKELYNLYENKDIQTVSDDE